MKDRRRGEERRGTNRNSVNIDVEWRGSGVRQPGTVSDISVDGCFVLSSGEVVDGEAVKVFLPLAEGMNVEFSGRVANHVVEIGFGVRFDRLTSAQRDLLTKLVNDPG